MVAVDRERDTTPRAGAEPDVASDEDIDALLVIGSDASAGPAALEPAPSEPAPSASALPEPIQAQPNQPEPVQPEPVLPEPVQPEAPASDGPDDERPTPSRAKSARGAPRPGTSQQGALFGQPTSEPPRRARRGRAPRRPPATRPAPPEPPPVREQDLADPTRDATSVSADARLSTDSPSRDVAPPGTRPPAAQTAPHAAVPTPSPATPPRRTTFRPPPAHGPAADDATNERSDAGSAPASLAELRRRVVMWLLEPDTPVIVPYERVQERFDLAADRTREVLGMILESPPPTLRLTLLREGMLRVSRVTVEQEA
jgi:hypothetical protein